MTRPPPQFRQRDAFPLLDAILGTFAAAIGDDFAAYRNHCFRVAHLCAAHLPPEAEAPEKVAVAAAFHDLGIWTDHTFDYLEPSVRLAEAWLADTGRAGWSAEIAAAIRQHHKLTRCRPGDGPLAEAFRRADWTDVTRGLRRFGLPRGFLGALYRQWPDAGFHRLLIRLELRHLRRHPLNPLPVLKL